MWSLEVNKYLNEEMPSEVNGKLFLYPYCCSL